MNGGWEKKGVPAEVARVEAGIDLAGLNFAYEKEVSFELERL